MLVTPPRASAPQATAGRIWAALLVVYVVWGSTYLAIRVLVVDGVPPLLAMAARFLVAGVLLAGLLALRRGPGVLRISRRQLASAGLVGLLLLLGGNGLVAVAEQTVPSGLAALLVAATPLWLVCLRTLARDRPGRASAVGVLVGFAGVSLLAQPGSAGGGVALWGVLTILCASFSWAVGSFFSGRLPVPANPFVATTYEMLVGGGLMTAAAAATGEFRGFDLDAVPLEARLSWVYLVVVGSLVAFSAYVWLLGNAPISLTATYAYVNPVVAVFLGALLLSEPVTGAILAGGAIVVLGVALVVTAERPRSPRPGSGSAASSDELAGAEPPPPPPPPPLRGIRSR